MDTRFRESWGCDGAVEIGALVGATITAVDGLSEESDEVQFVTDKGFFTLHHQQDCCEHVALAEFNGDPTDLIGAKVTVAEERTSDGDADDDYGSETWTFYAIRTTKGDLSMRWCGSSNGYYSESVSVHRAPLIGESE